MKKLRIHCFTAIVTVIAVTVSINPAAAADDSAMPQLHAMDLTAMPLVSRTLAEFKSLEAIAADAAKATDGYEGKGNRSSSGVTWLFTSLAEPLYLSLLGAGLLILGTVKGRRTR